MKTSALKFLTTVFLCFAGSTFLPAQAATTATSPRYEVCWGDNGTVINSNGDQYGSPNIPGNCYGTIGEFYTAFVDTINQYYPKPGDPRAQIWRDYGHSDYGPSYGATWVKTAKFKAMAYHDGPLSSVGTLYNDCTVPDQPWNETTHGYCGLERTDHYVWSCNTGSCMDWFNTPGNAEYDVVVKDFDMGGRITGLCADAKLKKTTNAKGGTNPAGCANVVDFNSACQSGSCFGLSNPIYPMTGAKREEVGTGFALGGLALTLSYDTLRHLIASADGLASAADMKDLPSFGTLWTSNLHRRLNIKSNAKVAIDAYRGNGGYVGFGLTAYNSGLYAPKAGIKDTLTVAGAGYRYFDESAGTVETYNSVGQLAALADKSGNVLTFVYSNIAGPTAPAAGYLMTVTDNNGRAVSFTYTLPAGGAPTADGLVSSITYSDGRTISATYDANKNLTGLTWQDGKTRSFLYENVALPWALTGKVDENGGRIATWAYDSEGRAISGDGAIGTRHGSVSYSTPPTVVITETLVAGLNLNYADTVYRDRVWQAPIGLQVVGENGQTSDASVVMVNGVNRLTGLTQPAGSGCAASNSASTFDARGNLLSQDDFQGVRTCYGYDGSDHQVLRVEGLANTVDCSAVRQATAVLPAGARKYTTVWDANWRAPKSTTQPGSVTTLVYHGRPDPKNGNTVANCSPATALPNGASLNLLCKQVIEKVSGAAFDNPLGGSSDPLIDKVVLLLHGEDGDGSPVFADSSSYMKTMSSRVQFPRGTTAQSKFGGSINLGANGGIGYGPDSSLQLTGDFTIELFVYLNPQAAGSRRSIFSWGGDAYSSQAMGRVEVDATGKLIAHWQNSYFIDAGDITGPVISTGVWHHVALSHLAAGHWVMHLDGVQTGSIVYNNLFNAAAAYGRIAFGVTQAVGVSYGDLNGYLDEVRVTNGAVRYWNTFTPPAAAFPDPLDLNPSAPKIADANYAKDILLIHADGVDGSTTLVDSSPLAKTGTVWRNAKISTTKSKFGGASFYSPGSTDYGDAGVIAGDYSLAGDFTVEFWMNTASTTAGVIPVQIGNGSPDPAYAQFTISSDIAWIFFQGGQNCRFGGGFGGMSNTWVHVAYVRIGGTIYSYINGVANGNCSWTGPVGGSGNVYLARNGSSTAAYYDDVRITKGLGRYTAAFIPSPYAFSNVAVLTPDASTIVNQYTYDAAGRKLTAKDSLNATTTYAYYTATAFTGVDPGAVGHTIGDLYTITDPKGFVTTFNSYDKAGRILQMTDPKGIVTDLAYTPRGWISTVSVTPPGGTARVTTYTYDFVGQVTSVSNPDGTTIGYTYDAAHRLIGATDAKGNSVNYTLDNMGNRINEQLKDPGGVLQRTMSRSFDALNRVQQLQLQ